MQVRRSEARTLSVTDLHTNERPRLPYSPGVMSAGTRTLSTMFTVVGQLPAHGPGLELYPPFAVGAATLVLEP